MIGTLNFNYANVHALDINFKVNLYENHGKHHRNIFQ